MNSQVWSSIIVMLTVGDTTRKNILAVLLAPLFVIPSVIVIYFLAWLYEISVGNEVTATVTHLIFLLELVLAIAYLATLILGPPSVLLLKRFSMLNYSAVLSVAVIASLLIILLIPLWDMAMLLVFISAASVASGYWLIYKHI